CTASNSLALNEVDLLPLFFFSRLFIRIIKKNTMAGEN
ncbi:MAG: hypothetical protein RI915_1873, partial [Pseudomonadota bacterium]